VGGTWSNAEVVDGAPWRGAFDRGIRYRAEGGQTDSGRCEETGGEEEGAEARKNEKQEDSRIGR